MAGYEVIGNEELDEIKDVFSNGGVLFRHGFDQIRNGTYKVRDFEEAFAEKMGTTCALAVSSGTAALRVALAALEIPKGSQVIAPSFTFVATVEAIIESGAIPICVDVDDTLNIDPQALEDAITAETAAVIVVHMLGTPARLLEIKSICEKHNLLLIEDTAWGCGGALHGRPLGTWGDVGTFSFDFAKTITTGEGGMLTFKDRDVAARASAWHDHGHENNPKVPRWEDTRSQSGFNFRMSELQGAVGLAQLRKLEQIVDGQRQSFNLYTQLLDGISNLTPRTAPQGSEETCDAYVFFTDTMKQAVECRKRLVEVGLSTKILPEAYTWHFAGEWSHMPELVTSMGGELSTQFNKSKEWLSKAVSLPISTRVSKQQAELAASTIRDVLNTHA